MTRLQPVMVWATVVLTVVSAILLARLVDRQRPPRIELTEARRVALAQGAGESLQRLGDPVVATYFVTPAAEMPSSMRRLERDVTDALEAMERTSNRLLRHEVLHPTPDSVVEKLATRYNARPFPVRTIRRDGYSEQSVHSSLVLASGPREAVTINGITPEHAARLPTLILAHLERMANPRPPRIAVAASSEFSALRTWLRRFGEVVDVDLDLPGASLPFDADLLVWMQPKSIDARRVRELELFLQQGRSAVVAASRRTATILDRGERGRIERLPWSLDPLLDAFGLRAVDGLLLDPPRAEVRIPLPPATAALHMRNIGADQDFRLMSQHLSASLLFATPTPIRLAEAGASRDGWSFETLASASDAGVLVPWPTGDFRRRDLTELTAAVAAGAGEPMPRAPLIGLLRPNDPWSGSLVLAGSTMPFIDGWLDRDGFAHRKLLDILAETLASPERLIAIDAWTAPAPPIPELDSASRAWWRIASILPLPILLVAVGIWRRAAGRPPRPRGVVAAAPAVRTLVPIAAALLIIVGVGAVAAIAASTGGRLGLRSDLTEAGSNSLAPETLELASAAPPVQVELFATERLRLPPRLRSPASAVEGLLRDLEARIPDLSMRVIRPETLDETTRERLVGEGIVESTFTDRDEEITTVRRFTCVVRLRSDDGRTEILAFPDEASFEHAEFRVASALHRLTTGKRPKIAVISDRPRPTPAEAHEFFQLQGLQPPMGTDVYSLAKQTLSRHDFEVVTLDHREPVVPDDADLLLWLQPRRPGEMLQNVLSRSLHEGRPAIVAAQNFNIQARLYPGRDHRVVYWPQPQWPDMQGSWFAAIGATLPRLVLLDELQLAGRGQSQVMGRGERRYADHETSLPFLIRAASANFDRRSPIMRGVGDQGFIWGSFIELNDAVLSRRGLNATTLITTSPRTWTFAWEGGFLPAKLIDGPLESTGTAAAGESSEESTASEPQWAGRLPLAVLLEGRFPIAAGAEFDFIDPASIPLAVPSQLLLISGSELFKDMHLRDPRFRGDHFLLNSVAALGGDPRLLRILGRRATPRGLDFVEPEARARWRVMVITIPALALLLLGGGVFLLRRIPPAPLRPRRSSEDAPQATFTVDGAVDGKHDADRSKEGESV